MAIEIVDLPKKHGDFPQLCYNWSGWWYTYPSEETRKSMGRIIPIYYGNTKCLKPPTSNYITDLTIQSMSDDKGCRFDWPRKKWMWLMIRCSWFISLRWLGSCNIVMCMYICQIYNYIQSVGWVKIRHQQTQLGGLFLFFYLRKHMGVTYRAGMSPQTVDVSQEM